MLDLYLKEGNFVEERILAQIWVIKIVFVRTKKNKLFDPQFNLTSKIYKFSLIYSMIIKHINQLKSFEKFILNSLFAFAADIFGI